MNETIIAVLGGMGPEASAKFYMDITKKTKAQRDQDHYRILIDSNSKIPDRSKNIMEGEESPLPEIFKSVDIFNYAKADVMLITCLTAHNYIEEIEKRAKMPVLNAISLTHDFLVRKFQSDRIKVGVLATNGSVKSGVFERYIDFEILYPSENSQVMLMNAIYGSEEHGIIGIKNHKSGSNALEKSIIKKIAQELIDKGANVIISGCTEIPLVLDSSDLEVNLINPMDVIIDEIFTKYK